MDYPKTVLHVGEPKDELAETILRVLVPNEKLRVLVRYNTGWQAVSDELHDFDSRDARETAQKIAKRVREEGAISLDIMHMGESEDEE